MRSLLGRFHRPNARSQTEQLVMLNNLGDGSTLSLDFTTGVLDSRLTFSRASGGTYVGNDGFVYGVDFATSSSLAIGTGSKSVTLTATAGQSRRYEIGQTVYIANGANNMSGAVTAYSSATQVLTINATSTSGSGSFTSWIVGNASARFDYDPTTLTPRGLLIEGSTTNYLPNSVTLSGTGWFTGGVVTRDANNATGPDGIALSATRLQMSYDAVGGNGRVYYDASASYSTLPFTTSVWLKSNTASNQTLKLWNTNGVGVTCIVTPQWQRFQSVSTTGTSLPGYFYLENPSSSTGVDVLAWGAQFEPGRGASSYIPTGASQGSRAADSCVMTGTNFSSWFAGATEGVLYGEVERPRKIEATAVDHAIVGTRYASGQGLWVYASATNQFPSSYIFSSGGAQFAGGIATSIPLVSKQAVRWFNANDITNFGNGTQGTTNTAGTGTMVPTMLTIGANSTSGTAGNLEWLNGCIRRVKFWPVALPDSQIIALTT